MTDEEQLKCLQCGGPVTPNDEKCPYCGYYNGHYYRKDKPQPEPEPTVEEEKSAPSYYSSSHNSGAAALKQVVMFAVVLLVVTIIGSTFSNGTIQADFTAGAVLAASLLGILLFLGAIRLIQL